MPKSTAAWSCGKHTFSFFLRNCPTFPEWLHPSRGDPCSHRAVPECGWAPYGHRLRLLEGKAGRAPRTVSWSVECLVPPFAHFLVGMLLFFLLSFGSSLCCRTVRGWVCGLPLWQSRRFHGVESCWPCASSGAASVRAGFPSGTQRHSPCPLSCLDRVFMGKTPFPLRRVRAAVCTRARQCLRVLLTFVMNLGVYLYKHLRLVPFSVVPTILDLLHFI